VVFTILCVTVIESTILLCYFHLCAENYHWWWRAFLSSGACVFYVVRTFVCSTITMLCIVVYSFSFPRLLPT
jgi:hypothetical protein